MKKPVPPKTRTNKPERMFVTVDQVNDFFFPSHINRQPTRSVRGDSKRIAAMVLTRLGKDLSR
jgi:hypothetical protein